MQAKLNDTSEIKFLKALETRVSIKNYVGERGIGKVLCTNASFEDTLQTFVQTLNIKTNSKKKPNTNQTKISIKQIHVYQTN